MVCHNHPVDTEVVSLGVVELRERDRSVWVDLSLFEEMCPEKLLYFRGWGIKRVVWEVQEDRGFAFVVCRCGGCTGGRGWGRCVVGDRCILGDVLFKDWE